MYSKRVPVHTLLYAELETLGHKHRHHVPEVSCPVPSMRRNPSDYKLNHDSPRRGIFMAPKYSTTKIDLYADTLLQQGAMIFENKYSYCLAAYSMFVAAGRHRLPAVPSPTESVVEPIKIRFASSGILFYLPRQCPEELEPFGVIKTCQLTMLANAHITIILLGIYLWRLNASSGHSQTYLLLFASTYIYYKTVL